MTFIVDLVVPLFNAEGKDFPYRQKNIKRLVENTPNNVHIILVEQQRNKEVPMVMDAVETVSNVTKICRPYKGPFCKGWLYNVGVRAAQTNHIVLGECDCWSEEPDFYVQLLKWVKKHKYRWAFAWNKLKKERRGRDPIFLYPKRGGSEGGLVYFNKEFYWAIGGHNEGGMRDLGAIDCEIIRRAEAYQKGYPKFPRTIIHGVHTWSKLKGKSRSKKATSVNYRINKKIYSIVTSNPKREAKKLASYSKHAGKKAPLYEKYKLYDFVK